MEVARTQSFVARRKPACPPPLAACLGHEEVHEGPQLHEVILQAGGSREAGVETGGSDQALPAAMPTTHSRPSGYDTSPGRRRAVRHCQLQKLSEKKAHASALPAPTCSGVPVMSRRRLELKLSRVCKGGMESMCQGEGSWLAAHALSPVRALQWRDDS